MWNIGKKWKWKFVFKKMVNKFLGLLKVECCEEMKEESCLEKMFG